MSNVIEFRPKPPVIGAQPFPSAADAWLWTMAALTARRDGARIVSGAGAIMRPCEPDDVVKVVDNLYRQRRITLEHARYLEIWGERQEAPRAATDPAAHRFWSEAMHAMEWPLRAKGIIA